MKIQIKHIVAIIMTLGLLVVMVIGMLLGGRDHAAEILINFGPYVVAAWAIAFALLTNQRNE